MTLKVKNFVFILALEWCRKMSGNLPIVLILAKNHFCTSTSVLLYQFLAFLSIFNFCVEHLFYSFLLFIMSTLLVCDTYWPLIFILELI